MRCNWCGNEYTSSYGFTSFCSQRCAMQFKAENQMSLKSGGGSGLGFISWLALAGIAIILFLLPSILIISLFGINPQQSAIETACHSTRAWIGSGVFWSISGWLIYKKFFNRVDK